MAGMLTAIVLADARTRGDGGHRDEYALDTVLQGHGRDRLAALSGTPTQINGRPATRTINDQKVSRRNAAQRFSGMALGCTGSL